MLDILALGELLIDFTPVSCGQGPAFVQNPGGAPANVLAAVARLGGKAGFIGKVGRDSFGFFLKEVLEANHIDTSGLVLDGRFHTTLAFVHLDSAGDRSFSFYRTQGADTQLAEDEIDWRLIDACKAFHFGSLSLTDEPARQATLAAVSYARRAGKVISFDPNWRPLLWQSQACYVDVMRRVLPSVDVIKVSEEELCMIAGCDSRAEGARYLLRQGVCVVVVTLGPRGCEVFRKDGDAILATYDTQVVDTTGAGDAFWGSFLYGLVVRSGIPPQKIPFETLMEYAMFANAGGALCASRFGAIPALATQQEIADCMERVPLLKLQ